MTCGECIYYKHIGGQDPYYENAGWCTWADGIRAILPTWVHGHAVNRAFVMECNAFRQRPIKEQS